MKSFAVLAFAATALAQSAPSGCQASVSGSFNIQTVNVTQSAAKRSLEARQLSGTLTLTLQNGILKDQAGRTGYIASNYQFQFDAPVQAGAREQSGFSLCSNGSLALGTSRPAGAAVFFQCLSGTFYNLYSQSTGAQCSPIYITAVNQGGASQLSDGQPQATPRPVSQISDGQPQASSAASRVVSQISDGQPQAPSAVSTVRSVVSQISDGQPQAPTAAPRPTGPVVSQISDGQPQAPTAIATTRPVVSQISDGQPQAPVATGNTTLNATRTAPAQYTGAAATSGAAVGALAAGLFGLFAYAL